MQTDLRECYRILEVEPGATLDEVKRAYRELVKVWHPDRFTHDLNLQRKAQEKLKQINHAYERICAVEPKGVPTSAGGFSNSETTAHGETPSRPSQPTSTPAQESTRARGLGLAAVVLAVVALVSVVFSLFESSETRTTRDQSSYSAPQPIYQNQPPPRVDAQPARPSTLEAQVADPVVAASDNRTETTVVPGKDYFTIGSTKDEVLAVQGTPFSRTFSDRIFTFRYGSQVFFKDERVTSWKNSRENPLKARPNLPDELLDTRNDPPQPAPASQQQVGQTPQLPLTSVSTSLVKTPSSDASTGVSVTTTRGYFTVGSTKDEVLAVQGVPVYRLTTDRFFTYPGGSQVFFENDRVTTWESSYANPLKAKLLPAANVESRGFFTVGSTKDEVLAVQGTPRSFSDDLFDYKWGSLVYFENGRVPKWTSSPENPLKAKLENNPP